MTTIKKALCVILSVLCLSMFSVGVFAKEPVAETVSVPDGEISVPYEMLSSGRELVIVATEGQEPRIMYSDEYETTRSARVSDKTFTLKLINDAGNSTYYDWCVAVPWSLLGGIKSVSGTLYVTGYDSQAISCPYSDGTDYDVGDIQYLKKNVANGTAVTVGYKNVTYTLVNGAGSFENHSARVTVKQK